jgi:hypothetical protein
MTCRAHCHLKVNRDGKGPLKNLNPQTVLLVSASSTATNRLLWGWNALVEEKTGVTGCGRVFSPARVGKL